jgi:hypothetical protein
VTQIDEWFNAYAHADPLFLRLKRNIFEARQKCSESPPCQKFSRVKPKKVVWLSAPSIFVLKDLMCNNGSDATRSNAESKLCAHWPKLIQVRRYLRVRPKPRVCGLTRSRPAGNYCTAWRSRHGKLRLAYSLESSSRCEMSKMRRYLICG